MVEAPRIRLYYDRIKHLRNSIILSANGTTYHKLNVNIIGYQIYKLWFAGKNLFMAIKNLKSNIIILKTRFLMYGRITLNEQHKKLTLRPNLELKLEKYGEISTLYWYLCQIKIVGKREVKESLYLMQLDISHPKFNYQLLLDHVLKSIQKMELQGCLSQCDKQLSYGPDESYAKAQLIGEPVIIVDLLLDQKIFPGVGNILQQEALYVCKINPNTLINNLITNDIKCLINNLHELSIKLYYHPESYKEILQIYHKKYCPLGHKTITKYISTRHRRTTWCPICQTK